MGSILGPTWSLSFLTGGELSSGFTLVAEALQFHGGYSGDFCQLL